MGQAALESAPVRTFVLAIALLVLVGVTAHVQTPEVRVIVGATLINPSAAPIPNSVIVITGGRITQAGPATDVKSNLGAEVIDARGKFVIPGLADMHNHLGVGGMSFGPQRENYAGNLGRLLALGITTVFDPRGRRELISRT